MGKDEDGRWCEFSSDGSHFPRNKLTEDKGEMLTV